MFDLSPTPLDVRLVAFRIPIRVHPTFWLSSILFGWNPNHPDLVFIWVMCSFVSVLVHELGHAFTAEAFDWPSEILLYFGGGLAASARYRNNTPWRSIAVSIMGPMAGFFLLWLIMGVQNLLIQQRLLTNEYLHYTLLVLRFQNYYYGLFNLLPVIPLDGGHICVSFCQVLGLRDPSGVAIKIGIVAAGAAAYYFLAMTHQQFAGIMMIMLCFQNVGALQSRR